MKICCGKNIKNIIFISLIIILTYTVLNPVNAASKPKAPKVTISATENTITFNWNKVKGAKKYQVATVSYKWKKYKKVPKTTANKKKFTKAGKYKVVVSGKKYQVYKVSKVNYKNKRTLTKNTYTWKYLKPNTTYVYAVRVVNGKKPSKWVIKTVKTTKNNTLVVTKTPNIVNNSCEHNWYTAPSEDELYKGILTEKCDNCNSTRKLYGEWIKTAEPQPEYTVEEFDKYVSSIGMSCDDPNCPITTLPSGKKHIAGWGTQYIIDNKYPEYKEINAMIMDYNHYCNTNFATILEVYEHACPPIQYEDGYGTCFTTVEEYCQYRNISYPNYNIIISKIVDGVNETNDVHVHLGGAVELTKTVTYPEQKEKGYWDFTKKITNPTTAGWTENFMNNRELAYGVYDYKY